LPDKLAALLAASLVAVAVLVAACGGSTPSVVSLGSSTSTTVAATQGGASSAAANYTNGLQYAHCMRSHGEPNFPDPNNPGGFSTQALARLDTASQQFVSADNKCLRLLPNDGQPTPAEFQQTIINGLRFAKCMRAHGVEFPDPGISGGQITINFTNIDPNSPQYLAAAHACEVTPGN